jgi:hypothetical protein
MYLGIGWLRRYLAKAVANMRAFSMGEKPNAQAGKETRMPACKCPGCGYDLDAATNLLGVGAPTPGDITICLMCGRLMKFTDALLLRELTGPELIEALQDERVARIEAARQITMAVRGPPPRKAKPWEPGPWRDPPKGKVRNSDK